MRLDFSVYTSRQRAGGLWQVRMVKDCPADVRVTDDSIALDLQATIADLSMRLQRYQTALETVPQGLCFFNREQQLVFCNRSYGEIYRLQPEDILPGTSLAEIVALRTAIGTSPTEADDYLWWCDEINSGSGTRSWTAELKDGRTIHVFHHPLPDGGWVSLHEDFTARKAKAIPAGEIISTQALIDWVPDYLWVKDTEAVLSSSTRP